MSVESSSINNSIETQIAMLKSLVTCSLCNDILRHASCLRCKHHFCMDCIINFTDSQVDPHCPKCKLPATRREAEFSPEFDKLVATYKDLQSAFSADTCLQNVVKCSDGTCASNKEEVISSIPVKSRHVSNFVKFRKRPSAETDSVNGITEKGRLCLNMEDFNGSLMIGDMVGTMEELNLQQCVLNADGQYTEMQPRGDSGVWQSGGTRNFKSKKVFALAQLSCAFCQTSGDSSIAGPMRYYEKGVPVTAGKRIKSLLSVHQHCANWAPNVYYIGHTIKKLADEVGRGQQLKCTCCGLKGAVLKCMVVECSRTYHYPCACTLSCMWDKVKFQIRCPEHMSESVCTESALQKQTVLANPRKINKRKTKSEVIDINENSIERKNMIEESGIRGDTAETLALLRDENKLKQWHKNWPNTVSCNWLLCSSSLKKEDNELLASFLSATGARFSRAWDPNATHLIVGTDAKGVARRTLNFLFATLAGKWVLKAGWLAECLTACRPVEELPFEIRLDRHGTVGGPNRGRSIARMQSIMLFEDISFYFLGNYKPAYKADLQALVFAAGGGIMVSCDQQVQWSKVVVYNADVDPATCSSDIDEVRKDRLFEAKSLAYKIKARVVEHTWIPSSIASYQLLPCEF